MYMRKIISLLTVLGALLCTSCDHYIDIKPTGDITIDSARQYLQLVAIPNRAYYPTAFAMLTDNSWIKESTVFGNENISFDGINTTFNEAADRLVLRDNNLYENCYDYILRQNIVLSEVDASIGDDATKWLAKAEARTMRAWDHFVAVNTFAKAYDPQTAGTDGGVAIVSEYNLEKNPTKATVAEVYDFILREIDESAPQLSTSPLDVYHPSRAFGYAFQALAHLFHRDWQQALEAAEKSLELNNRLVDYVALQEADPHSDWKTATPYAKGDNPEVLNYAGMGGVTDNLTYTYGMISPELVQLMGPDDCRLSLFFKTTGNSSYYFDEGSGAALWNSRATYTRFYYSSVGLRTAEVYLIKAECQTRLGDLAGATATLNLLRAKRIRGDSALITQPATEQEMMMQVITERRKELLFGFHRFWDLKRLNTEPAYATTVTRTFPLVSTDFAHQTYTLRPGSSLYIIPFPESVRSMNPNITNNY